MSSEVAFFSSSSRSMRSMMDLSWSLAKRCAASSLSAFSTAAVTDIDISLNSIRRADPPPDLDRELSELRALTSRQGERHPHCSQARNYGEKRLALGLPREPGQILSAVAWPCRTPPSGRDS